MKWTKLTLKTTVEAIDLVSNMLDDIGIEGIEIKDNLPITEEEKKAMFIDLLPELEPSDGTATVSFYMDPKEDLDQLVLNIQVGLEELANFIHVGSKEIEISETEDKDWINNWKEFFKPFRLEDNIVIKPTWEELKEQLPGDIVVEIDPGTAFGTGSHETTKLAILGLKKYINCETKLLDVGCGSGILSIIALKLGAQKVFATDIDPQAITATYENASVNQILTEQFCVLSGNIIEDAQMQEEVGIGIYDIVVANILANVIIPLSGEVGKHLKPGGLFITSGILNEKKEEVEQALIDNGFTIIETNVQGDWVSIIGKK